MKRSPELTPLSRDHHKALSTAQRLSRTEDAAAACRELLDFWTSHGRGHFQIEEDVLLPIWLDLDPAADREMAQRVMGEHLEIRAQVRRARGGTLGLKDVREVGRLLADHVRFEERELFPLVESHLDPASLADLGREIDAAESDLSIGSAG